MDRRTFITVGAGAIAGFSLRAPASPQRPEFAITMDDPKPDELAGVAWPEINRRILGTLDDHGVKAALFVTGMRVDNAAGPPLLREWDDRGHLICNHTYSHKNYNSTKNSYEWFAGDFLKNEPLIRGYRHFTRLFRYPALKEGDTAEKRDAFRSLLSQHGYRVGQVTVDMSDWYIDARMRQRLEKDAKADTRPYCDYYVAHVRDRSHYYRQLAAEVLGHDIRHTILVHHNLLNAFYLADAMQALREDGWKWIDAAKAFHDPVFRREPKTLPAGESLVWALAKETGRYDTVLRYPGEDDVYEKPKMDALGL